MAAFRGYILRDCYSSCLILFCPVEWLTVETHDKFIICAADDVAISRSDHWFWKFGMTQVNTTDYKYKDCVLSKHSDHVIYPQRLSGGSMSGHRLPYRMLTVIAIAQIGFTCNGRFISHGRFVIIVRVALNIVSSAPLKDISTGEFVWVIAV